MNNLKENVYMVLGGLIMIAILWWYGTSEQMQHHRFIKDCGERHTKPYCEDLWQQAGE